MAQTKDDQELRESVEQLRKDMSALRDDLRSVASSAVGAGQKRANAASHELNEQLRYGWAQAKQQARAHPLETAGIALGIGFLVGKLFSLTSESCHR